MRTRKPCVFLRCLLFGWKVRFISFYQFLIHNENCSLYRQRFYPVNGTSLALSGVAAPETWRRRREPNVEVDDTRCDTIRACAKVQTLHPSLAASPSKFSTPVEKNVEILLFLRSRGLTVAVGARKWRKKSQYCAFLHDYSRSWPPSPNRLADVRVGVLSA